ncbi:hypothetical protein D210916BOD24_26990 [Alteromonas sp. D210916BOD_24]
MGEARYPEYYDRKQICIIQKFNNKSKNNIMPNYTIVEAWYTALSLKEKVQLTKK